MLLKPCKLPSKLFSFQKNMFSADASEIGDKLMELGKVFLDSEILGFTIVSEKTGGEAVFAAARTLSDREDTLAWEFVCVTPGLSHLKAVIYND